MEDVEEEPHLDAQKILAELHREKLASFLAAEDEDLKALLTIERVERDDLWTLRMKKREFNEYFGLSEHAVDEETYSALAESYMEAFSHEYIENGLRYLQKGEGQLVPKGEEVIPLAASRNPLGRGEMALLRRVEKLLSDEEANLMETLAFE